MNYLAHLFLAGEDESNIVGNFLGDFVKGNPESHGLDEGVIEGIRQHRLIDRLADERMIALLNEDSLEISQRRYAGIVFDIACDHFLSRFWHEFSSEEKSVFSRNRLVILQNHNHLFCNKAVLVLNRMERYQWLENYQHLDFIEEVFKGIHKRFPRENRIDEAFIDLKNNYDLLQQACLEFTGKLAEDFL